MDRIGGMNIKEYTDKWGGEDWELLDRYVQVIKDIWKITIRRHFCFSESMIIIKQKPQTKQGRNVETNLEPNQNRKQK